MNEKEKDEKRQLLSQLIKMAQAEDDSKSIEFEFLVLLVAQMGISKTELIELFEQYIELNPPKLEHERILQFQRLVLMMNADNIIDENELSYLRQLGIRMGLHPMASEEVLRIMNDFPNKIVPAEKLIQIFKTFHN